MNEDRIDFEIQEIARMEAYFDQKHQHKELQEPVFEMPAGELNTFFLDEK